MVNSFSFLDNFRAHVLSPTTERSMLNTAKAKRGQRRETMAQMHVRSSNRHSLQTLRVGGVAYISIKRSKAEVCRFFLKKHGCVCVFVCEWRDVEKERKPSRLTRRGMFNEGE